MTYNEIIQSVGKQIDKKVYYYENNVRVDVNSESIDTITIKQNCDLIGTMMKCIELKLKESIETNNALYIEINVKYGDETAQKVYGPYYIYETNYNADEKEYEYICYDAFLKTMVEYKTITMTYPSTVQTFYNTLITSLGLTSNVNLINGNIAMEMDIYSDTGYTYRSVIQDIAEANGILLYIDGTQVKEVTLGNENNEAVIDDDILKNTNIDFGETYGPINVIALSRAGDGDTIYYPENLPSNIHEFKISDNIMLGENNRSQFIAGIYTKLNGINYGIFDTELVGYGGFDPLQKVKFETGDNVYNSYVFNNEIKIDVGYSETIYTDTPKENNTTNYSAADTTDNRIKQTYIIVNKQTQEIKSVVQNELYDSKGESKMSQLTQTVDDLKAEIGKTADITTLSDGIGTIKLENILTSETIYLQVRPTAVDINYKITNQCVVGSNTLLTTPTIYFKHYNDSKEVDKVYKYTLPKALYIYNTNTYDEYIIDYENNRRYIIHRVGVNQDGTKYALDNSYEEELTYESYKFDKTGDYDVLFEGFPSAYIKIRAMVSNIYTSQYATRVELNSSIQQTADSITAQVNEKVGNDEIIAKLNLAVKGDKGIVQLTGNSVTIDSDNFELTEEGNITCNDATMNNINVNGGQVILNDVVNSSGKVQHPKMTIKSTNNRYNVIETSSEVKMQDSTNNVESLTTCNGVQITTINSTSEDGGYLYWDENNGAIRTKHGSNVVNIQTSSSQSYINVGSLGYDTNITAGTMKCLDSNGTGWWYTHSGASQHSDKTLKEDIKYINNELSKNIIKDLKPVDFRYIGDSKHYRGLIAQDVVKTLNNNGIYDEIYSKDDKGKYMLSYEGFIADLIGCNKYLINKVEELEKRISNMEEK